MFPIARVQAQDVNWSVDVGSVGYAGDSSFDGATEAYHIKGAGVGLTGSADAFHFAYCEIVRGDGQMVVRVSSADALAQVALVIRESLDAGAASAAGVIRNGSAQFFRRALTGDTSTTSGSATVNVPCWLKLVRSGNTISTFVSADGQVWTGLGSGGVTLSNSTVYVGFAVSNGAAGANGTAMASFDSIQSTFLPNEGLALWLKADAGVIQDASGSVSGWADQSGNSMDAAQAAYANQPQAVASAINGQPAIRFDGSNSYLQLPSGFSDFTQGITVLLVTKPSSTANYARLFDLGNDGGTGDILLARLGTSEALGFYSQNATFEVDTSGGLVLNQFALLEATQNPATQLAAIYRNGTVLASTAAGPIVDTSRTANYIARCSYSVPYYAGDIAEMAVFNRVLSETERQTWEHYLNAKYDYAPVPPAPVQVVATPVAGNQAVLSWLDDFQDINGYRVERQYADGSWSVVATLGPTSASYLVPGLTPGTTYTFRIIAVNSTGDSVAAQVALSIPTSDDADLPFTGLQLWLRADSGTVTNAAGLVSRWTDRSGSEHHAQPGGNQPAVLPGALNGKAVVRFSGSQYLSLPDVFHAASATAGELILVLRNTAGPNTINGLCGFGTQGGTLYPDYSGNLQSSFGAGTQYYEGTPAADLSQFNVYDQSSQAGLWQSWMNGVALYQNTANTPSFTATPALGYGWPAYFTGDVAEVLAYDRVLTASERRAVTWYLAAKYLLPNYDLDGDGLTTAQKQVLGLDPFNPATNGNGLWDTTALRLGINPLTGGGFNYATPPNPNGNGGGSPPPANPDDHTPPVITLTAPASAVAIP